MIQTENRLFIDPKTMTAKDWLCEENFKLPGDFFDAFKTTDMTKEDFLELLTSEGRAEMEDKIIVINHAVAAGSNVRIVIIADTEAGMNVYNQITQEMSELYFEKNGFIQHNVNING